MNNEKKYPRGKRFTTIVRKRNKPTLGFTAYLTDHLTGCKFSNTWDTKKQCKEWLKWAMEVCKKGRPQ